MRLSQPMKYIYIITMARNIAVILIIVLLAAFTSAQTCPQLCTHNCTNNTGGTCSSCYVNFLTNSNISSDCSSCPTGMYKDNSSRLCFPCPSLCLTCNDYSVCVKCIPGFMLSNSYQCIPGALTSTSWLSKNVSYEFTSNNFAASNLAVWTNSSSLMNNSFQANNTSLQFNCSKMPLYTWFGSLGSVGYQNQIIKSTIGLSPHQWVNIRFQAVLIDDWRSNTLLVEASTMDSYNLTPTQNSTTIVWSGSFNASQRNTDFCGNPNITDNLAVIDSWFSHNLSSLNFIVRLNQSQIIMSSQNSSYLPNLNFGFGIRQLFIRVGTCGRNCKYCSSPTLCTQCYLPYALVNGTCSCNGVYGFPAFSACSWNCMTGTYYNSTAKSCFQCSYLTDNCQSCNSLECQTCLPGYFYYNNNLTISCLQYCPNGLTQTRNYTSVVSATANTTIIRDQCTSCPLNCATCNGNICLFCFAGYLYHQGACISSCPATLMASDGSCSMCSANCQTCSSLSFCNLCSFGFMLSNGICVPYCRNSTQAASSTSNICNVSCSSSCLICSGPSSTECTACPDNTYLFNGSCFTTCPISYYFNYVDQNICLKCLRQCNTCYNSTSCLTCAVGYYYYNVTCLRLCPPSTFSNVIYQICESCAANCLRCTNAVTCFECNQVSIFFNFTCLLSSPIGYYFDNSVGNFLPCPNNCDICNGFVCSQCSYGWFLNSGSCGADCPPEKFKQLFSLQSSNGSTIIIGKCSWKSPLCKVYNSTTMDGSCSQCNYLIPNLILLLNAQNVAVCSFSCPDFFGLTSPSSICLACPVNCRRCNYNLICYECLYNYVLNAAEFIGDNPSNTTCVLNYCPQPYFSDSVQCQLCPPGCSVCQIDGWCYTCQTGFVKAIDSQKCILNINCNLTSQYYSNNANACLSCSSVCSSCLTLPTSCTSCPYSPSSQTYYYNYNCITQCPNGYFAHQPSLTCRKCNPKCFNCTNFYNCLSCAETFSLLGFYDSSQAQCVAECPIGFWSSNAVCQLCYQDCQSCFGPSQFHCLSCYPNFFLDDYKCVYSCSIGKYADKFGYCDYCDPSCQQCNGPSRDNCILCGQNYYLSVQDHQCFFNQCPGATYLAIPELRQCQKCQFGCSICDSPQFCRFCFPGYHLYQGWCYLSCPGDLVSRLIYFYNQLQGSICDSCQTLYSNNCLGCNRYSCKRCRSGLYLHSPSQIQIRSQDDNTKFVWQQCFSTCPNGTYPQSNQHWECVSCPTNCNLCTSSSQCQTCSTGYNLINGYCTINCPSGTYATIYGSCSNCPANCQSCASTNCTSCQKNSTNYLNLNTTSLIVNCVPSCPTNFFVDASGWCQHCPTSCIACTAYNTCTQCISGYSLSSGICTITNSTTCNTTCSLCSNGSCLQCDVPYLLLVDPNTATSQCVTVCPAGYFQGVYTCNKCSSSCLACTNTINNCIQCQSGLFLFRSSCVNICPVGYFAKPISQLCLPCPSNCLNCYNMTSCVICKTGYFIYNGQCYTSCPTATYPSLTVAQCYSCVQGCNKCPDSQNCTSCLSPYFLFNKSCVASCPQTTYIYQSFSSSSNQTSQTCLPCLSPCYTCTSKTACISCIGNYIINGTVCQQKCQQGYYQYVTAVTYENEGDEDSEDDNSEDEDSGDGYKSQNFKNFIQCRPCNHACKLCTDSSSNCQLCNAGYVLYGNKCMTRCPAGSYKSDTDNSCRPCSSFCLFCNNSNSCLSCTKNTVLSQGNCLITCPRGYYAALTSNSTFNSYSCQKCSVGCSSCNGSSQYQCSGCSQGYYLTFNNLCVIQCPAGTYANALTMTCSPCPSLCATCISFSNCSSCINNYTLSSTNQCTPNSTNNTNCSISNCLYCLNSTYCLQCQNNFFIIRLVNNSYCTPSCPSGMFSQDKTCIYCTTNCSNCSANGCLQCITGNYLYQMKCYPQCPAGTVTFQGGCQPDPCIRYNSTNSNICSQCAAPYMLATLSTRNSTNTSGVGCTLNCPNSTVSVKGICLPCSLNCQTCVSSTICTQCLTGYSLFQGICQLLCPLGYYSYNSECNSCTLSFCIDCIYSSSGQYCLSCDPSKQVYLYKGNCLINCPSGTYKSLSGSCLNCSTNCNQCYNKTYCLNCTSGYNFQGLCITTCPIGTYAQNVSNQTICQGCSSGCYLCNSSTNCIICSANYNWIITNGQGACVTTCPLGTYPQSSPSTLFSNSNSFQCIYCMSPCLTCTSLTSCSLCSTGSLYLSMCVNVCPTGFYSTALQTITVGNSSYTTRICSPCSTTCLNCIDNSNYCTACHSGFTLDSSGNCNSNCSSPFTYFSVTTRICFNCSQLCYSCYGPTSSNCLSCSPPRQLYAGVCLPTCPFGFFGTSTYICQPCSLSCASCQGINSNCTSCNSPNIYQNINGLGSCITNCLSNYYLNSQTSTCTPCSTTCSTCYGLGSDQCNSCLAGLYLVNAVCLTSCPNGTIAVTINLLQTCQSCPQGCPTCIYISSNQTYQCTSCIANLYLYNGMCNPNCPPTTYASPSSFNCLNCNIDGCQTCSLNNSFQVQCIVCQVSYYMLNSGICVINCPQGFSASGTTCIPVPVCLYFVWNGYCLNNCPSGTYPLITIQTANGTNSTALGCANCSANCLTCTSSTACSLCSSNSFTYTQIVMIPINGVNVTSTQIICVNFCPQGYYSQNNICVQCPSPCSTCQLMTDSSIGCITCTAGYILLGSNCINNCPSGYLQVSSASGLNYCQQCSAQCATCQGTPSNCIQCQNNLMTPPTCTSSNCSTAAGNSSYLSSNGSCVNCNSACLTCFGGNSYECLSCPANSILQNGMCLSSCPSGYIQSSSTCNQCPTNCQNCSLAGNNTICSLCTSPYILSPTLNQCVLTCSQLATNNLTYYLAVTGQCQPCNLTNCLNCIVISQITQCQTCQTGAFYYNGQCYSICPNGTASSYNPNTCTPCPQNCTICSSSSCNQCSAGSTLLSGGCVTVCPVGYYLILINNASVCQPCLSNCLNCSSTTCNSCKQPFSVDANGQCTNCIDGYYYSNSASACLICSTLCQTCLSSSTQCISCPLGTFILNFTCITVCPTGYYSNSINQCVACSTTNCKLCPNNICQSCASGWLLVSNQTSCPSVCPSGMYADSSTGKCFNCSQNCSNCISITSCNNCASPSTLYLGYCIANCPSGFTNLNQSCVACISTCKVCTSLSNCSTCQSGLILNANGSCSPPPSNCTSGYYLNSMGTCSQCYPTCNTCNSGFSSSCLTCFSGYTLSSGVCIQNCNSTSFYSTNLSSCVPCNSLINNCTSCTSSSICTICDNGFGLSAGTCQQSCPNGTYLQNQQCVSCSSYCTSCKGPTDCNQCTNTSVILINGKCYVTCPTQTYLSNGSCLPCTQTCIICSASSTNCSSCITPYFLSGNSCIAVCPNGTYGYNNYTCLNCSANCILCTDANTCTSCATTYYILNGTCRNLCPSGYYIDFSSNRCIICTLPCLVCTNRTSCSSCQSSYLLNGTSCISNCTTGYYNTSLSTCINCSLPHCSYCTSSGCFNCKDNYYAVYTNNILTNCTIICPIGKYGDPISKNCTNCFSNCLICSNTSWCNYCANGSFLLIVSGSSINQCDTLCPLTYYQVSNNNTCQPCSTSCNVCGNGSACIVCSGNYYLYLYSDGSVGCVKNCPYKYATPTLIDGTGQCTPCPANCSTCADSNTCTQCISSSYITYNGQCIPSNCLNCQKCNYIENACNFCNSSYYLYQNSCNQYCLDGYYANNVTSTCNLCMTNCLLCNSSSACILCITGYVFANGTGCENEGFLNYGVLGNMSGFTSNITQIVGTVYVATSSGPIAFGALTSTYGPMQFCQFLYLLQGSTAGNQQMNTFLDSLSVVSYTNSNSEAKNNGSSSTSKSNKKKNRMLTSIEYTSSFLQTNVPIFVIMLSFLCAYIAVTIFSKYTDSCCLSCPNLQKYMRYICDFMQKRFKWIYVDCVMWISYLPFLYFSILQIQNIQFSSGIQALSSLIAIVIIILYPLYPLLILRLLFDKSDKPEEHLKNYKDITLRLPLDLDQVANKSICADFTCCPRQNPDLSMIEMSLSPFIDKVVRPVYNEDVVEYSQFKYFKLEHWRLGYAAIKYVRKFIFVLIAALCPDPVTTLALLVTISLIYIGYLIILKPKEKLYLILEIILQSVLTIFILFMLIYVSQSGSTVAAMSVVTHAIGFILANSTLVIAIILNIMSYYTIFCCIVDLVKHLKNKVEEEEHQKVKKFDMLDEKYQLDDGAIQNNDKQINMDLPNKKGDDQLTVQNNNEDDNVYNPYNLDEKEENPNPVYDPYNLDEKEFQVRSSMLKKKETKQQEGEDIPDLRQTNTRQRRNRKEDKNKIPLEEESHTSQELGNSNLLNNEEHIINGNLKDRERDRFKRVINPNDLNVNKGELKQTTEKYRRNTKPKVKNPPTATEQQSFNELFKPEKANTLGPNESRQTITTNDRIIGRVPIEKIQTGDFVDRQPKRKLTRGPAEQQLKAASRGNQDKPGNNLKEANMYLRNQDKKYEKQIQEGYLKQREKARKAQDPFGQFEDVFEKADQTQKLQEIQAIERNRKNKEKMQQNKNNQEFSADLLGEANLIERVPKKPENKYYKNSDEQQDIGEVETKERKKGDYRKKQTKKNSAEQQVDINAVGRDHTPNRKDKTRPNKEFAEDTPPENIAYKQRVGKKIQNKGRDYANNEDPDIFEVKGVQREKKQIPKKNPAQGYFDAVMNADISQSIQIKPQNVKKKAPRDDFEEQTEQREVRQKRQVRNKQKDNLLGLNQNLEETYEDVVKKNKQQVFKQDPNKRSKIQDVPDDFEEVSYSRPESKIEKLSSRSKDLGLGVGSRDNVDSQDESRQIRKGRQSAIMRNRKISQNVLGVNDNANDDQKIVGSDSRRISRIVTKNKKTRGGNLNIEDMSQDEDLEQVNL